MIQSWSMRNKSLTLENQKAKKNPTGSLVHVNKWNTFSHNSTGVYLSKSCSLAIKPRQCLIPWKKLMPPTARDRESNSSLSLSLDWHIFTLVSTACSWTIPRVPQISPCVSLYLLMSPFSGSSWLHFPAILLKTLSFKPSDF